MIYRKIDLYEFYNIKRSGNQKGYLNVYCKENNYEVNLNRKYPGILICPGGGYSFVSFREGEPLAIKFLEKNVQAFVIDYTCENEGKYPDELLEGYLAYKYIIEHALEFNLDINKVGIIGFSAGGHYAGMISNFRDKDKFKDILNGLPKFSFGAYIYPVNYFKQDGSHNDSFFNLVKDKEILKTTNFDFENLINKDSPKAFLVTTYEDELVGYKNTLSLANKYSEFDIPFELHIFKSGKHGMAIADESVYKKEFLTKEKLVFNKWFDLLIDFMSLEEITLKD